MYSIRFLFFLLLPLSGICQDAERLFREGERLEASFQENEAFLRYAQVLATQPGHLQALCKCSDLCSRIGNREKDKARKIEYFKAARNYAATALIVNPNSSLANFEMAVAMGCTAMVTNGREKIRAVNDIRKFAEHAIRQDPGNFRAYFVLGRWHYEVSNLNSVERTFARLFLGGMPEATLQESILNYEKCRSLNPLFILNYMELAKAYRRNGQNNKAVECLHTMIQLPNSMLDDIDLKITGKKMIEAWSL